MTTALCETRYAHLADEFLRTYFVLGVNNVRLNVRYFIMAHCLELAFKASLGIRSVPISTMASTI